jgi:hypothetical protein
MRESQELPGPPHAHTLRLVRWTQSRSDDVRLISGDTALGVGRTPHAVAQISKSAASQVSNMRAVRRGVGSFKVSAGARPGVLQSSGDFRVGRAGHK